MLDDATVAAIDELVEIDEGLGRRQVPVNERIERTRIISSSRTPISWKASISLGSGEIPYTSLVSFAIVTQ